MVTGDYHYTATSVARRVGMIPSNGKVFIIQAESEFQTLTQSPSWGESEQELDMPSQSHSQSEPLSKSAYQVVQGLQAKLTQVRSALRTRSSIHLTRHFGSDSPSGSAAPQLPRASSGLLPAKGIYPQTGSQDLGLPQTQSRGAMSTGGGLCAKTSRLASVSWHLPRQRIVPTNHGWFSKEAGHPHQASGQVQGLLGGLRHPQAMQGSPQSSLPRPVHLQDDPPLLPEDEEDHHLPSGHDPTAPGHPQHLCQGLRLTLEGSGESCQGAQALEALASIAEGQAQCCVTGSAFAHLLHQADLSVLKTVMQNAVVFARMQSSQKGQVMELLGSRGLYQMLGGHQRHIPVSLASFTFA